MNKSIHMKEVYNLLKSKNSEDLYWDIVRLMERAQNDAFEEGYDKGWERGIEDMNNGTFYPGGIA